MDYISKVLLSINNDTPAMFNAKRHFLSGGFGIQLLHDLSQYLGLACRLL